MVVTHVEFASAVPRMQCASCGQPTAREAVLVNQHGLVLLQGRSCATCGRRRHRVGSRNLSRSTGIARVPVPRLSA